MFLDAIGLDRNSLREFRQGRFVAFSQLPDATRE